MKMKAAKHLFLAAAALCLAACSNDEKGLDTRDGQVPIRLSSSLEVQTRAGTSIQSTAFDEGERVDVFITEDAQTPTTTYPQPLTYTTEADGTLTLTEGEQPYFPTSGNGVNIHAYYPAGTVSSMSEGTTVNFEVARRQDLTDENYKASDLMYGKAENPVSRQSNAIPITFRHLLSKITVNLTSGDGNPSVTDATVILNGIRRDVQLNPSSGEVAEGTGTQDQSVWVVIGTEGSAIIPVQTVQEDTRFIRVSLSTLADLYYELPEAATFQSGKVYTYNIKVNLTSLEVTSGITDWTIDDDYSGDDSGEAVLPRVD